MPQEAADQVNQVANAFDGDGGFNRDQIAEMLNAIGFIELSAFVCAQEITWSQPIAFALSRPYA